MKNNKMKDRFFCDWSIMEEKGDYGAGDRRIKNVWQEEKSNMHFMKDIGQDRGTTKQENNLQICDNKDTPYWF